MNATITVLPGDGIGPEVTREAVRVLHEIASRFGHRFTLHEQLVGGAAFDTCGSPLPNATLEACRSSDAVLLGAVGGPRWTDAPRGLRPEDGLLKLRSALGLFANMRPVRPVPALINASPLKPEIIRDVDLVVVRELTGGIYFGAKTRDEHSASDTCAYSVAEIERIIRVACRIAMDRRKRIVSVDKANVLETSRLWRSVAQRIIDREFPAIRLEHMLVDNAAMQLVRRPADFDVLVTENMFGDILSDEAAAIAGSIGMLPSASLAEGRFGLYEPIHGSAPDIAGRGMANPCAAILSAAMLLRDSLGLEHEARTVESAVARAVHAGVRTPDIAEGLPVSSTSQLADTVIRELVAPARGPQPQSATH